MLPIPLAFLPYPLPVVDCVSPLAPCDRRGRINATWSQWPTRLPPPLSVTSCRCASRAGPNFVAPCRRCHPKDASEPRRVRCPHALRDRSRRTRPIRMIQAAVPVVVCFRVLLLCHLRSPQLPFPKLALVSPPSYPHAAVRCAPVAPCTPSRSSATVVYQRVTAVQGGHFPQCLKDHGAACPAPVSGREKKTETSQPAIMNSRRNRRLRRLFICLGGVWWLHRKPTNLAINSVGRPWIGWPVTLFKWTLAGAIESSPRFDCADEIAPKTTI